MFQPGFFDVENRLQTLSEFGDPLEKLASIIDFESFRETIEQFIRPAAKVDFKDAEKKPRPWKYNYFLNCRKPVFEINNSSNNIKL